MLELKHVSYSYQSYQEEISQTWTISSKWDILQHYRSVWSREIDPPLPLAGLDNPKKGQVLFDGGTSRPKGLATTASIMSPWSFRIIIWLIIWRHWKMSAPGQQTSWERHSLGIGAGRNANQTQCPATIRRAATTGGYCACARFRSTCHLSRWADRKLRWTDSWWHHCHFKETGQGTPKMSSSSPTVRKWQRPPMWSWNWVAVASLRKSK